MTATAEKVKPPITRHLTVADMMEWEELPEAVRRLARWILLGSPDEEGVQERGGDGPLREAYDAGWEDGVESCTVESNGSPHFSFKAFQERGRR